MGNSQWTCCTCCPRSNQCGQDESPPPELTSRQKALLKASWTVLEKEFNKTGIVTFAELFETHPKGSGFFRSLDVDIHVEKEYMKILRNHPLRVMATIEKCIHRLDNTDNMHRMLEDIGARHHRYKFKMDFVELLGVNFLEGVKIHSEEWNLEIEGAWMLLIQHMTFYHAKGYCDLLPKKTQKISYTSLWHSLPMVHSTRQMVADVRSKPEVIDLDQSESKGGLAFSKSRSMSLSVTECVTRRRSYPVVPSKQEVPKIRVSQVSGGSDSGDNIRSNDDIHRWPKSWHGKRKSR